MSDVDGSHAAGRARLRRVGHKGADLIAPGNTYASFDAALAAGVDMIEFDVLPEAHGDRLILAHDYEDAARRVPHTLEEGLAYLAAEPFAGIELDVDLKLPGYELRVLDALRDAGAARARADLEPVPVRASSCSVPPTPTRQARLVGAEADPRSVPLAQRRGCRRSSPCRRSGLCSRGEPRGRSGRKSATR